ncbi:MAG: DUF4430 domain-containing protein [Gordonibacter sp.]
MLGSLFVRIGSDGASIPQKLFSLLLSLVLAASLVPSVAWADATSVGSVESASPTEGAPDVEDEQPDAPALVPDAAAPSEEPELEPVAPEATKPPSSDSSASKEALQSPPSNSAEQAPPLPVETLSTEPDSERAFDKRVYVFIQDAQDKGGMSKVTGALEVGTELWANVNDYASDTSVAHDASWSYQWLSAPSQSSSVSSYVPIPGQTSQNLAITDELARQLSGSYLAIRVTVEGADYFGPGFSGITSSSVPGPIRLAGAVDIYATSLAKGAAGTYVFSVGDTVTARAKEKGATDFIGSDKLNYQWQVSTDNSVFTDIAGQTACDLMLDAGYEGKFVRCAISAKIGASKSTTTATKAIGAVGTVNVTSVSASKNGNLYPGDVIVASAASGSVDVTTSDKLTWSWYRGNTAGTATTRIEDATTSTLTVTEDMMGAYLVACVDGGFGEVKASAAGPVVQKGAFKLYKVEASGSAEVGKTLNAVAYGDDDRGTPVSDQAIVSYQWQYASTSTTSDTAFKDIPGATSKAYTVAADMLGNYLRVKATSLNVSTSTSKPYGGSTQPVSPLGPVKLAGAYDLSSVKLASSGQAMQAGAVITPTARYKKGSFEYDVPADAKVTYTWLVSDAQTGTFVPLASGADASGKLTLDAALVGKWVKVSASALVNDAASTAYRVLAEGGYDLLRVMLSPNSGDLFTGDKIAAKVQAKNLTGLSTGDDVSDNVSLVWSVSDTAQGVFVPLDGVGSKTLAIPAEAAGKFLKATATSGDSSVEAVTSRAVVDSDTLEGAARKLEAKSFKATPTYGQDANINEVVRAKLAELGYNDIAVTTKSAVARKTNESATVGVSVVNGDANGDITYFFMDPDEAPSMSLSYTQLRQFDFTFVFSRGDQTYEYAPFYAGTMPWDESRVSALLEQKAEMLAMGFASGDTVDAVTKNITLPYKLKDGSGATKSWSSVAWASSDKAVVAIQGSGWADSTGKVVRSASDRTAMLTATVSAGTIASSGGPVTTIEKAFPVTVKGDPDKMAAEKAALEKKVQANFTYDNLKLVEMGAPVDKDAVAGDLSLPNPGTIGVDGKYYAVAYKASNDAVVVNTYRGAVYRPLPAAGKASVDLTVTVTDKANPEITATKTLSIQIAPLEQVDVDRELELMEAAKSGYFAALANGQSSNAVTQNLHAFQKAYFDASGALAWTYDYASTNAAGSGIVPVDLEGYDSMGSEGWRLFKSSRPNVVAHENLLVKQPEYNTPVTLNSRLSSEKYARYAERYPENTSFQQLANQNVSAAFTVVGTSGQVDPWVTATCSVIGVDKDGNQQTWAAAQPYTLASGATVEAVSEAMFEATGLTADFGVGQWGWALNSLTSPFDAGLKLAWGTLPNKGWSYYVNGKDLGVGAGSYAVQPGDSVMWRYGAWDDPAPTDQLSVTCEVVGANVEGAAQTWASPATLTMGKGTTAADLSKAMFSQTGLKANAGNGSFGWYLNSIFSPYDGVELKSVEVSPGVWRSWQLFINGAYANTGASGYTLQAGDTVSWVYGSDGTMPGQVAVAAQILGLDASGTTQVWARESSYRMIEGATAADLSEQVFAAKGIEASYDPKGTYGWVLESVTSPFSKSVTLVNESVPPYRYWQLFINGKSSDYGAGSVALQPGDRVVWCYSTYGSSLPSPGEVVIVPDASRPSYDSSWAGFGSGSAGGAVVERPTPSQSAEQAWAYNFKEGAQGDASVSEPLVVNGSIYLVVNGELRVVDAATGAVKKDKSGRELRANVGSTSAYCNRPVYSGGIVVVPSDNGSLTAFTADTLTCVWKTSPLGVGDSKLGYQSLSSLTVNGSYVYAAFTMVGAGGVGVRGTLVCVNLADGTVAWMQPDTEGSKSAGYYWAGAAASGDDLVIGDESGAVKLVDGQTGNVLSSVSVGASVRAGIVSIPATARGAESTFAAVATDGVLHVITRNGDTLSEVGSVKFASKSTSTPASTGGKAFVCGLDADGYGTLSVIDLEALCVAQTVRGGKGEAQSSPLVSVQSDGTYAYFTCNGAPGGVYGYRLGDVSAYTLFTPGDGQQSYGLGSVVADEKGNLYYTNDSGHLFALKGQEGVRVTFESNGGSYVGTSYVALGKAVLRPTDPVRQGSTFDGWFSNAACTAAWDFNTAVQEGITLYAKWKDAEAPGGNTPGGDPSSQPDGGSNGSGGSTGNDAGNQGGKGASGYVSAANAPLTKTPGKSVDGEKKAAADASSKSAGRDASASGKEVTPLSAATGGEAEAAAAGGSAGGVNPWAAGGIAAGVVGLACATVYLVRTRRKPGTPGTSTEGK